MPGRRSGAWAENEGKKEGQRANKKISHTDLEGQEDAPVG